MAKPEEYSVADYYHDSGYARLIATSPYFENLTLLLIAFNTFWIGYDADCNSAVVLSDARIEFQIAEHFFCFYFALEWLVRFCAFKVKQNGLRDRWFVFDSSLVMMMVLETWIFTLVIAHLRDGSGGSSGIGNISIMKLIRLFRLTRMARMIRLLRAVPELIILIKALAYALRPVFFTLVLLVLIMYLFAIGLRQLMGVLSDVSDIEEKYYPSVPNTMFNLLMDGVLPDQAGIVRASFEDSKIVGSLVLFFILVASLAVMNMLIGVLCEVVSSVSSVEKEQLAVGYVRMRLIEIMAAGGMDQTEGLSRDEFESLLVMPDCIKILNDLGVDVVGLIDTAEFLFPEDQQLGFEAFMEVMLQLRGSNFSTVKDIVDLRRAIRSTVGDFEAEIKYSLNQLACKVYQGMSTLDQDDQVASKQSSILIDTVREASNMNDEPTTLIDVPSSEPVHLDWFSTTEGAVLTTGRTGSLTTTAKSACSDPEDDWNAWIKEVPGEPCTSHRHNKQSATSRSTELTSSLLMQDVTRETPPTAGSACTPSSTRICGQDFTLERQHPGFFVQAV